MENFSDDVVKCGNCNTYVLEEDIVYCEKCGKELCPHCAVNYNYCEECSKEK